MRAKTYIEEIKVEAIRPLVECGRPVVETAELLNVSIRSLYDHKRQQGKGDVAKARTRKLAVKRPHCAA